MAYQAADGSKWTNASQARKVPGRSIGDGKQPVSRFSKPEAPRQPTAQPVSAHGQDSAPSAAASTSEPRQDHAPTVEVTHDGNMFVVTAKYASEQEAHEAAQALQSAPDDQQMNPSQAMM